MHARYVDGPLLLIIVRCKVLGRVASAVVRPPLNSPVLEDAGRDGGGGALDVAVTYSLVLPRKSKPGEGKTRTSRTYPYTHFRRKASRKIPRSVYSPPPRHTRASNGGFGPHTASAGSAAILAPNSSTRRFARSAMVPVCL